MKIIISIVAIMLYAVIGCFVSEKVSKVTVIKDVQEWNSDVYSQKYWSESPWTNWFYSEEIVDSLEYIEMEE